MEQPYEIGGKPGRLSVAPAARAETPGYSGDDEGGDTALPKIEERSAHDENRKLMSSKRMVSNFLRSRRRNVSAHDQADSAVCRGSPAFV